MLKFCYIILLSLLPTQIYTQAQRTYIVQFKAKALQTGKSSFNKSQLSQQYQNIQSLQGQFEEDALQLSQKQALSIVPKTIHRYYFALSGLSINLTEAQAQELRNLPYVSQIDSSRTVHLQKSYPSNSTLTVDLPSQNRTRVPQARTQFNVDGTGIIVAILDTGIDYNHPDLGGCLGINCKVIGGYDFANNIPDPIDVDGHGTHVAGIVAANGSIMGVAPEAKLYAYKVFHNSISSEAIIIAGIEKSINPDADPLSADAVDIVQMSLGASNGSPNSPVSLAVNNAVANGVLCVVAAGNEGINNRLFTIQSPADAEDALTIGASDNNDILAPFSGKGFANVTFGIKPDILAPGVEISSTYLNNSTQSLSGTSMATPHVSGIAALLKELKPALSPTALKSLLVQSAQNLNLPIWEQGNGRIDAVNALTNTVFAHPVSLNFGKINTTTDWTNNLTLSLQNIGTTTLSYNLTAQNIPMGASIRFSPETVVITPQSTAIVDVDIFVQSNLPFQQNSPYSYPFTVIATNQNSPTEIIRVPAHFVKAPQLLLSFTGTQSANFAVIKSPNFEQGIDILQNPQSIDVPEGNYNIFVLYEGREDDGVRKMQGRTVAYKENIVVNGITDVPFNYENDLSVETAFSVLNPDGLPQPFALASTRWRCDDLAITDHHLTNINNVQREVFYLKHSPLPSNCYLDLTATNLSQTVPTTDFQVFTFRANNLNQNQSLQNSPTSFKKVNYEFSPTPNVSQITSQLTFLYNDPTDILPILTRDVNPIQNVGTNPYSSSISFSHTGLESPIMDAVSFDFWDTLGDNNTANDTLIYKSGQLKLGNQYSGIAAGHNFLFFSLQKQIENTAQILNQKVGKQPTFGAYNETTLTLSNEGWSITTGKDTFKNHIGFVDNLFGHRIYPTSYEIATRNNATENWELIRNGDFQEIPASVPINGQQVRFNAEVRNDYQIKDQNGYSSISIVIDEFSTDVLPHMLQLKVLANEIENTEWSPSSSNKIAFKVPSSWQGTPTVFIRPQSSQTPIAVTATLASEDTNDQSKWFEIIFDNQNLSTDFYDLHIEGKTQNGTITIVNEPAFYFSDTASADLRLNQEIVPLGNGQFRIVLSLENSGPDVSEDVVVQNIPLSNYTIVNQTAQQGTFNTTTNLWTIGDVAPNTTLTLVLTVTEN